MPEYADFLTRPGVSGPFGALMDESARAAEDFCRVIESIPVDAYQEKRGSGDPDTLSLQDLCTHVVRSAHRYADYIRKARGLPYVEEYQQDSSQLPTPGAVRLLLKEALQYTEAALEGFYDAPEETVSALKFQTRWGPTYDPEMILEHGIVHILRHRRQVERWIGTPT